MNLLIQDIISIKKILHLGSKCADFSRQFEVSEFTCFRRVDINVNQGKDVI